MGLCNFSDDFSMMSITPVENIFIDEFMPGAPSDYVKVYLYGLRLCNNSTSKVNNLKSFARVLGLEADVVRKAMEYWSRYELVTLKSEEPLECVFHNVCAVMNATAHVVRKGGDYSSFNASLQALFKGRLLNKPEYDRAYEWLDSLRLPEDVVIMLVQYCIDIKDPTVGFNYIDRVASDWAKNNIFSVDAAEEYIAESKARLSGAARVMGMMGVKRTPTTAEMVLYDKWIKKYGLNLDAVLLACRETAGTTRPSMKYLDKIITGLYEVGATDKGKMSEYIRLRNKHGQRMTAIMAAFGVRDAQATLEQFVQLDKWISDGFKPDTIVKAAERAAMQDGADWSTLCETVEAFRKNNLMTPAAVRTFYAAKKERRAAQKTTAVHYSGQRNDDYNDIFVDLEKGE